MGVENNIPEGWLYTELGKVSENIFSGGTPNTRINKYWNGSLNWLSSGETGSNFIYSTIKSITQLGVGNSSTRLALKDDVVVATAGQGNTRGQVSFMCIDSYINQSIIAIRGNKNALFNKWLFYNLSCRYKELRFISESNSVRGSITTKMLSSLIKLKLPPLPEQKAIAKVLTAFDDKIELLQAQNKTLETMAQTIFKEWFGKYQIGDELPEGWRVGKLGDVMNIFDSKRVPLSKPQREAMSGVYRYYGATKVMDYVNDYLFDGIYLLFAEDGSVMDEDGYPFLQYVWGKFWVNNHTHILKGKNSFSTELLYVLCKKMKVAGIVNGAVQLKINQRNLLSKEIVLPNDYILEKVDNTIQPLFNKLRINSSQIQSLTKTRDTLLPKLMSGQVRVKNIKQTTDA